MRNFENFVTSYLRYAEDGFCPPEFHLWSAYTIISAALERKCWLRQGTDAPVYHFPNIYTLLVGYPGSGKSTALNKAMNLYESIKENGNPEIKIVPNQITEAALIEMLRVKSVFRVKNTDVFHSSALFFASEASSSALKNAHGDFNATMTDLYDCPRIFRKQLKGDKGELKTISNACMSALAGTTFDFLKRVVNEESVMGGLASRFIYVISEKRIVRQTKWNRQPDTKWTAKNKLCEDLLHINKLTGEFQPTEEYIKRWEEWQPKFDEYLISLNSPRLESIMARKTTHIIKLSMVLSVAESDKLILDAHHWDEAVEEIEKVTLKNASVVSSAVIADKSSQIGLTQLIGTTVFSKGEMTLSELKSRVIANGNPLSMLRETLTSMQDSKLIKFSEKDDYVKALVDPTKYI